MKLERDDEGEKVWGCQGCEAEAPVLDDESAPVCSQCYPTGVADHTLEVETTTLARTVTLHALVFSITFTLNLHPILLSPAPSLSPFRLRPPPHTVYPTRAVRTTLYRIETRT